MYLKNVGLFHMKCLHSQRARLLDNTETLERSSRRLDHGYRIALETGKSGIFCIANLIQ